VIVSDAAVEVLPMGAGFESQARPLLELVQRITGLETSFVTEIDWEHQRQDVVFALNTGEMVVGEGTSTDWSDSMCRWTFLNGQQESHDVATDFPGSIGAEVLGMRTFFALPILDGDATIGTVCGASRRVVELGCDQLEMILLISESLAHQMKGNIEARAQQSRVSELTSTAEAMQALALSDAQTGLANRRGFDARWEAELARSGRHHHPIGLLVLDIDGFKQINDDHGHDGGDRVLEVLGAVLRSISRLEDIAARRGGDEFALVVAHASPEEVAAIARRAKDEFARATTALGIPCTLTVGVSLSCHTPRHRMLSTADKALYRGKARGRDRVEVWRAIDEASALGPTK